jgi:hypothetical protein
MPSFRPISGLAVLLSAVLAIPATAAEPPWLEIHSAHFTVITDAGEKKGREVAFRFEQMRSVFATLLGKERLNQPVPLTILAYKNDKTYYQIAPLRRGPGNDVQPIGASGFFVPGEDQDFIVLNTFEEESWRAVSHDFAHMLLNYNYPPAQGWFDEGLAEYFSSIRLDNKHIEIGGDPELVPSVRQDLLGNQSDARPPKSLTELLDAQVWIGLPDLFSMKHDTSNEGTHHTLYYAESWIVIHYLLHEQKLPQTGEFFNLVLNERMPIEDAIQKAYGMTSAQLEQAVKDYLHSQAALMTALDTARQRNPDTDHPANPASVAQAYSFPTPVSPDDSAVVVKPLAEDDARAFYAGVQIRIPDRRDAGLKQLQSLATTPTLADKKSEAKQSVKKEAEDPDQLPSTTVGDELAHRFLAWDHIQQGDFDAAFTELGDAASLNQRDMWIRYYLSVAKKRMAEAKHTDTPGLPNMMLDLKAVLEWYPEFAAAYDLLAQARSEGGGAVAAMQAERAAMNLSPREEGYVYHLALIYIANKQWEAADVLLERLRSSANSQIAALARDRMAQAASERKYGIVGAAAIQPKLSPQKSPFDVLEQDAAQRAAAENAQHSGGPSDQRPTKFLKGRLVAVDCSQAPAAIVTVAGGGTTLKLRAGDYKSLLLIGADDFSCSWTNRQVSVNYKPGGTADGDLVSLEVR